MSVESEQLGCNKSAFEASQYLGLYSNELFLYPDGLNQNRKQLCRCKDDEA